MYRKQSRENQNQIQQTVDKTGFPRKMRKTRFVYSLKLLGNFLAAFFILFFIKVFLIISCKCKWVMIGF